MCVYNVEKNRIVIKDLTQFNARHILECGQFFRYLKIENGYVVYCTNKKAIIIEHENYAEILTNDVEFFVNFFDLKTDYTAIKNEILELYQTENYVKLMKNCIDHGYGIRLLKQNPVEMLISFIISANNRINRIQHTVSLICKNYGENMGDFFAFPTLKALATISEEDFKKFGAGFRAKYLVDTIKQIQNFDFELLRDLNSLKASEILQKFKGVGNKVADCILLFAYSKMDVFPVDTWIEKVYNCYFSNNSCMTSQNKSIHIKNKIKDNFDVCLEIEASTKNFSEKNRLLIRKKLTSIFGNLSGYAQQYLFYYKREMN